MILAWILGKQIALGISKKTVSKTFRSFLLVLANYSEQVSVTKEKYLAKLYSVQVSVTRKKYLAKLYSIQSES